MKKYLIIIIFAFMIILSVGLVFVAARGGGGGSPPPPTTSVCCVATDYGPQPSPGVCTQGGTCSFVTSSCQPGTPFPGEPTCNSWMGNINCVFYEYQKYHTTTNGNCDYGCQAPEVDCPGESSCINLNIDNNNCGSCGNICIEGTSCVSGTCQIGGGPGGTLCPTTTDYLCAIRENNPPNTQPADPNYYCAEDCLACTGSYLDCDAPAVFNVFDPGVVNGCEVNSNSDHDNCGACGVTCGPAQDCVSGVCQITDTCADDLNENPNNNINVRGAVSGSLSGNPYSISDYCDFQGFLKEYYCNTSTSYTVDTVDCGAGYLCENGACPTDPLCPVGGDFAGCYTSNPGNASLVVGMNYYCSSGSCYECNTGYHYIVGQGCIPVQNTCGEDPNNPDYLTPDGLLYCCPDCLEYGYEWWHGVSWFS